MSAVSLRRRVATRKGARLVHTKNFCTDPLPLPMGEVAERSEVGEGGAVRRNVVSENLRLRSPSQSTTATAPREPNPTQRQRLDLEKQSRKTGGALGR